jgi:dipeptidyl aminopeptidase/acylaminoacyl peptidase
LLPGSLQLHINPAILSAAGYAVLMPSLPERASPSSDLGDLGPELAAIVQAACAASRCDAERAALIGHSFGGYGVLRAATQTDAFRAIIASNGYGDLSEAYEPRLYSSLSGEAGVSIQSGWLEGGQGGLGVPLGTNPRRYIDRSPLYAVDRIHTPTLLIQSDFDGSRFDSIFGALYRLNREAELVTYFGESHEFVSPANIRDLHLRILAWLDRYLGPSDPRDASLPGPRPDLQRAENEKAVGGGVPD